MTVQITMVVLYGFADVTVETLRELIVITSNGLLLLVDALEEGLV